MIATPRLRPSYSETFIRNHILHLEGAPMIFFTPWYLNTILLSRRQVDEWLQYPRPVQNLVRGILNPAFGMCERAYTRILKRSLERNNASVMLAEFGPVAVSAMEACRQLGVPLVVHFHGFDAYKKTIVKLYRKSYRKLFSYASAIVAVSKDMEERLKSFGAPQSKLHYNPYGVDCSLFGGATPEKNSPVFVAVGRFVKKKAPHLTLRAFRIAQKQVPNAKLLMIGKGTLLNECKCMVNEMKQQESGSY